MKNILDERPIDDLHGRCLYTTNFVDKKNIEGKTVLDIGCGYGWFELFSVKNGVKKIVATEINEKNFETAKKYLKNKKIIFTVSDSVVLPFDDESFDTVVSWEVIEHIPSAFQMKYVSEISRVLKKRGTMYLSTQNFNIFANIFDLAWWFGHRHYKMSCLKKMFGKFGFKLIDFKIKGNFWEIFYIFDLYFSKWVLRRKSILKNFINPKNDEAFFNNNGIAIIFCKFRK